jgi:cell division protein FtsA
MPGAIELAEEVFHVPVRTGIPQYVVGLTDVVRDPVYATGVGLLLFGHRQSMGHGPRPMKLRLRGDEEGTWDRMKKWFHGNF